MLLTMTDICNWAGENVAERKFVEGERVLKAGHIIKCGKNKVLNSDTVTILSVCLQTSHLRDKPHEINGEIKKTGEIINFKCSCKAGNSGKCKHIIATLLFMYRKDDIDDLSCTDKKCAWKSERKRALQNYEPAPLLEHECFKKKVDVAKYKITESQKLVIKNLISSQLPNSALMQHQVGRHQPVTLEVKSKVSDEEKIAYGNIFKHQDNPLMEMLSHLKIDDVKPCCTDRLKLLVGNYIDICIMTKDHYDCWQRERQYRITGSVCYSIYTYTKNKKPDWAKKSSDIFHPKNFKSIYTEYGKKSESEAREMFVKSQCVQVFVPGLIVSVLNPWLAYSPDGVIYENGVPVAILEIKCPYKGKTADINATVQSVIGKYLVMDGENLKMKKNHQYYGQIQLGMIVVNVKLTYFVIYSTFDKNLFILKVSQDLQFTQEMLIALKKIYYGTMLHTICVELNNN